MTVRRLDALLIAAGTFLAGCRSAAVPDGGMAAPGDRVGSAALRVTDPAPQGDVAAAVAGHAHLALDLHRALAAGEEGNLFFSPASIAFALSMTYAGAAGDTATAFRDTLHVTLDEARYHRAMNDLDRQLESRGSGATGADGQPFRLGLVNQLFAQKGFPFEAPFLDVLAQEYGADVRLLDFVTATEAARVAINEWVARETEDRIPELLAEGVLDALTRAVLVNAIYFNAAWDIPFRESATASRPFTLLDGTIASVPTMWNGDLPVRAAQVSGVEVVELPYDGGELSMVLLVPPAGEFLAFERQLTAAGLQAMIAALGPEHISLTLPRFEVRTSASLRAPLVQLGLGVAFDELAADFSRMSAGADLCVKDVVHQAWVKVNEAGTEAAAATAVVVGVTSLPVIRPVAVDRPFLFLVRDHATGAIVFLGRVVRP
jgi:serpin B